MSKYTAEQVEEMSIAAEISLFTLASVMLRDYAALLRERESAKAGVPDDLDYVPGELDRTAPVRIWLQIDTAAFINDRDEPWPGCDDVTWQDESVGGLEIQYVRADLVVPMLASARVPDVDLVERCKEVLAWKSTGLLRGDYLREYAKAAPNHDDDLQWAEEQTKMQAMRVLAAAPKPETEE